MGETLNKTQLAFIETSGGLCQRLGLPRSTGQIYGLLYLSLNPLPLEDIASLLSMSKASASTGSRQLLGWQAIRQVWVPGDRRDYFEARADLRDVLRAGYENLVRPKMEKSSRKLESLMELLDSDKADGSVTDEEYRFSRDRLRQIESFQKRVQLLLPLAEKLF